MAVAAVPASSAAQWGEYATARTPAAATEALDRMMASVDHCFAHGNAEDARANVRDWLRRLAANVVEPSVWDRPCTEYEAVVPRTDALVHIIWNVLLGDKTTPVTPALITDNGLEMVVAIVPSAESLPALPPGLAVTVLAYGQEHEPSLSAATLAAWDEVGARMDALARLPPNAAGKRRQALVFCNSGFQRSLPFLCRYLTRHHADEVPDLGAALDIVLPAVDRAGYVAARPRYLAAFTALGI